jgi:cytoskeletal protein RodZ
MAVADSSGRDFGTRIRKRREERGVTLRQIADTTKISIGILDALERNDVSRLPGGIFSRAFVRLYAGEVGLDPEQTVRDFLAHFPEDPSTSGASSGAHAAAGASRWHVTSAAVVVVATAIIGVILLIVLSIG